MLKHRVWAVLSSTLLAFAVPVAAEEDSHHHDHATMDHAAMMATQDHRQLAPFPADLAEHTRANMRDHLLAIQEITDALANGKYELAADTAEKRLGMSSLPLHGAHDVAPYMPPLMAQIGTDMHRAASEFAVSAQNVGVTGDLQPALSALAKLQSQCVACHAGFRLK